MVRQVTLPGDQPRVLVAGLRNPVRHQVMRQIQKVHSNVVHIPGDIRKNIPNFDLAVVLICGISHQLHDDILAIAREQKKPVLTTGSGFSSIKEQFHKFVQMYKEKNAMNQPPPTTSAIRIFLSRGGSRVTAIKYVVYYMFRQGEEFTTKELRDMLRIHCPDALDANHHFANFMQKYCTNGVMLQRVHCAIPNTVKLKLSETSVDDFAEFQANGYSVEMLKRNHAVLFLAYQSRQNTLGALTEELIQEFSAEPVVEAPKEPANVPPPPAPSAVDALPPPPVAPTPQEQASFVKQPTVHPQFDIQPQSQEPAAVDFPRVLGDVRATAELLLDRVSAIEGLLGRELKADDEAKDLAEKAKVWLAALPMLATATPEQLAKLAHVAKVL